MSVRDATYASVVKKRPSPPATVSVPNANANASVFAERSPPTTSELIPNASVSVTRSLPATVPVLNAHASVFTKSSPPSTSNANASVLTERSPPSTPALNPNASVFVTRSPPATQSVPNVNESVSTKRSPPSTSVLNPDASVFVTRSPPATQSVPNVIESVLTKRSPPSTSVLNPNASVFVTRSPPATQSVPNVKASVSTKRSPPSTPALNPDASVFVTRSPPATQSVPNVKASVSTKRSPPSTPALNPNASVFVTRSPPATQSVPNVVESVLTKRSPPSTSVLNPNASVFVTRSPPATQSVPNVIESVSTKRSPPSTSVLNPNAGVFVTRSPPATQSVPNVVESVLTKRSPPSTSVLNPNARVFVTRSPPATQSVPNVVESVLTKRSPPSTPALNPNASVFVTRSPPATQSVPNVIESVSTKRSPPSTSVLNPNAGVFVTRSPPASKSVPNVIESVSTKKSPPSTSILSANASVFTKTPPPITSALNANTSDFEPAKDTTWSVPVVPTESLSEYSSARSTIEQKIENSKIHWSEGGEDEVAETSNVEVFEVLQKHSRWGSFFRKFGKDELIMGKKIAEGGQAEIYEVEVKFAPNSKRLWKMILKVFKTGSVFKDLQKLWPPGLLLRFEEIEEYMKEDPFRCKHFARERRVGENCCELHGGTLLDDGRFAFLLQKRGRDLRSLIDQRMKEIGHDHGPFSLADATEIMYKIANGMKKLHKHGIVHRDLKAANVLITDSAGHHPYCVVADFESSSGVVGTGYFRPPEILQAIQDRGVSLRPGVLSNSADIYSYGMVCYEILTGKLPFEGQTTRHQTDHVLIGERPDIPAYVGNWIGGLLTWCWQHNPADRPSFDDIICELVGKWGHLWEGPIDWPNVRLLVQTDKIDTYAPPLINIPPRPARITAPHLWPLPLNRASQGIPV